MAAAVGEGRGVVAQLPVRVHRADRARLHVLRRPVLSSATGLGAASAVLGLSSELVELPARTAAAGFAHLGLRFVLLCCHEM